MEPGKPFILQFVGTKFEIVPYLTKDERRVLRYRIIIRHFAPPSRQEFIATPVQMEQLWEWLDLDLCHTYMEQEKESSE